MFANRIIPFDLDLPMGGAAQTDFIEIDFDGTIIEIVASVSQPTDVAQANGTSGNAKKLYELVQVLLELKGTAKGGTLPITDGEFAGVRSIGGSSELPGKEWRIEVTRQSKLNISAKNIATVASLDNLHLHLDFRAFDKAFPKVEATA